MVVAGGVAVTVSAPAVGRKSEPGATAGTVVATPFVNIPVNIVETPGIGLEASHPSGLGEAIFKTAVSVVGEDVATVVEAFIGKISMKRKGGQVIAKIVTRGSAGPGGGV